MSKLKFFLLSCTGVLLVGLAASAALSQDPPPRERGDGWDSGPTPGGPPRGEGPRRPRAQRGDADGPPGPPQMDEARGGDRPQPPRHDPRRAGPPRVGDGDRPPRPDGSGPDENGPRRPQGPGEPGEHGPPP